MWVGESGEAGRQGGQSRVPKGKYRRRHWSFSRSVYYKYETSHNLGLGLGFWRRKKRGLLGFSFFVSRHHRFGEFHTVVSEDLPRTVTVPYARNPQVKSCLSEKPLMG